MSANKTETIVERLQEAILDGRYGAEASLPSVRALSLRHGIARSTANRVLQELVRQGLAERRNGLGFYPLRRMPSTFALIFRGAETSLSSRIRAGIGICAKKWGKGIYSLLCAENLPPRDFAARCIEMRVAGVFLLVTRQTKLLRETLALFKEARIPVVLIGGTVPSARFHCDCVTVNAISGLKRERVRFDGEACPSLIRHGELIGEMAFRLMLQRLSYMSGAGGRCDFKRHPPVTVHLDLAIATSKEKEKTRNEHV